MKNVGESQLREVLNYEVRVPASGDQEEAVVKLSGSDFGVRVQAEHKFIGAVFAGLKPELWFNGERIDFGTKEALEREFETVVRVTGNKDFHCEKWRRRFIRLINWRAEGVLESYQVGKYVPEDVRKQEIAVELSKVLNVSVEQITERLLLEKSKICINGFCSEKTQKEISIKLSEYWFGEGFEYENSIRGYDTKTDTMMFLRRF